MTKVFRISKNLYNKDVVILEVMENPSGSVKNRGARFALPFFKKRIVSMV